MEEGFEKDLRLLGREEDWEGFSLEEGSEGMGNEGRRGGR